MARSSSRAQLLFTSGVVSPRLAGRTDIAPVQGACRTLQNMLVSARGAAVRRAGTEFIASAKGGAPTSSGAAGPRTLNYDSGWVQFDPVAPGGRSPPTVYTARWTITGTEVGVNEWDVEVHGYLTKTGGNPPFDGVAVQVQGSVTPADAIMIRFINYVSGGSSGIQDEVNAYGNIFGGNNRSGVITLEAETAIFSTHILEFHPADTYLLQFPTINMIDYVS